jgi:hypothetical protein
MSGLATILVVSPEQRRLPKERIQYNVDKLPAGDRIVRSVGLESVGQPEIGAYVAAGHPHDTDHQVMDVLRFNESRANILEIEEDTEPFSSDHPSHWGPGVRRAIALRLAGDAVMRRNRLTGQAEHPNRGHFAVACVHITDGYAGRVVAERGEINRSTSPWGSGWQMNCGAVDHTADHWHQHHLTHLVNPRPFVMPYLCMPEGSMVVFEEEGGAIVWGAGSESGARDPDDPRAWSLR